MGQMYFPGENRNEGVAKRKSLFAIVFVTFILTGFGVYFLSTDNPSIEDVSEVEIASDESEETTLDIIIEKDIEETIPSFTFEALRYFKTSEHAEVEYKIDFPTGNTILADSVRKHINEYLGNKYHGDLHNNQAIIDFYGDKRFRQYENAHKETFEYLEDNNDEEGDKETFTVSAYKFWSHVKIDYLEDKYVTYREESCFWTGGAHELCSEVGVTFSRKTGQRIGYSFFKNLESSSFKRVIKTGLKKYFSDADMDVVSDEALAEYLDVEDVDNIPLPSAHPYFTPDGICFKYHSYEIASYAAGFPSFILSYDEAREYLSDEAYSLILSNSNITE